MGKLLSGYLKEKKLLTERAAQSGENAHALTPNA